jgi:uncharacterized protein (TIGR00369 family)
MPLATTSAVAVLRKVGWPSGRVRRSGQTGPMLEMTADEMTEWMQGLFPGGVPWTLTRVDEDGVTLRMEVDQTNVRPGGTIAGPTVVMLADSAAYAAVMSHIGPKPLAVTSNINVSFLRRPKVNPLIAEGTLLKLGRSLAFAEVSVFNEGDPNPVSHAVVTYSLALADAGIDPHAPPRTS